jgi:hypothetical protein
MYEDQQLDLFAQDFLNFLNEETGSTETLRVKVLLCDEHDWKNLAPLRKQGVPATSTSKWQTARAYVFNVAWFGYPTGGRRRSTRVERLEKLTELGFRTQYANAASEFDVVVLLHESHLPTCSRKLVETARELLVAVSITEDETWNPTSRKISHILRLKELYREFKEKIGKEEFERRYHEVD